MDFAFGLNLKRGRRRNIKGTLREFSFSASANFTLFHSLKLDYINMDEMDQCGQNWVRWMNMDIIREWLKSVPIFCLLNEVFLESQDGSCMPVNMEVDKGADMKVVCLLIFSVSECSNLVRELATGVWLIGPKKFWPEAFHPPCASSKLFKFIWFIISIALERCSWCHTVIR